MQKSLFLAAIVFSLLNANVSLAKYFHLELGGANYGQEGHTKKAVLVTYRANEVTILDESNFFSDVKESARPEELGTHDPETQYYVLFRTLDQLIERKPGEEIEFHINDIRIDWTEFACQKLREYVARKNYAQVKVVAIPGNYFFLDAAQLYDSVHLKNIELMYSAAIDDNQIVVTDASRERMRKGLQKLANLGKYGLHFFIIDSDIYFPHEERVQFSMAGKFYQNDTTWKGLSYHLPDGSWKVPESLSHVFFVSAQRQ